MFKMSTIFSYNVCYPSLDIFHFFNLSAVMIPIVEDIIIFNWVKLRKEVW